MKLIDRHSQRKLYLQLVEIIEDAIEQGDIAIGAQLPTEDQLCSHQGVSKAVVRAAMQELVRKGYVKKIPGRGTFVQKPVANKGIWLSSQLTENVLDFGVKWDTEVVQKMLSVAPPDMSELFSMEKGQQVFKVIRLRSIDDKPIVLETAYVSHELCPGFALEDLRSSSILDLMYNKYGISIMRCADSIECTRLEDKESELLQTHSDRHALLADRILYTSNNRVVAFIRLLSISENHRISYEFIRPD